MLCSCTTTPNTFLIRIATTTLRTLTKSRLRMLLFLSLFLSPIFLLFSFVALAGFVGGWLGGLLRQDTFFFFCKNSKYTLCGVSLDGVIWWYCCWVVRFGGGRNLVLER